MTMFKIVFRHEHMKKAKFPRWSRLGFGLTKNQDFCPLCIVVTGDLFNQVFSVTVNRDLLTGLTVS